MNDIKTVKSYWRRKRLAYLLGIIVSFAALALLQSSGLSSSLKDAALCVSSSAVVYMSVYLLLFSLFISFIMLPLSFYEGYLLEHRFNLSNQGMASWTKDELKGGALSFIVFVILVEVFYAIAHFFPGAWWIIAAAYWVIISVVLARVFPRLIIPLFFKYSVVKDPDLRRRILELAGKFNPHTEIPGLQSGDRISHSEIQCVSFQEGREPRPVGRGGSTIKVAEVFEIDLSRKTKKANAAIVGWGRARRIILADNLVKEFTPEEVEVVLAHEMAHQKLGHIRKLMALSAASIFILFFILRAILPGIASALGAAGAFDITIFPTIYMIFIAFELVMMPVRNGISRKLEKDADVMALRATGLRQPFISLMDKLADKNLSDRDPNPVIEALLYNHPAISRRIKLAEEIRL